MFHANDSSYQSLVNILPNGPEDGGLIVCAGSHKVSEDYHRVFKDEERIPAWTPEWYGFKETGLQWLKERGCEWVKVETQDMKQRCISTS